MNTQHQKFQRRTDGTIDIDFYRQLGLTERRIVIMRFFRGMGRTVKPLVAVAAIVAAICVAPARDRAGWTGPSASYSGTSSLGLVPAASAGSSYAQISAR